MTRSNAANLSTLSRGFAILEWIHNHGGGRPSDVADHFEMSSSTVHRYLHTLEDEGYLVKKDGEYHLGIRFLGLGEKARTRREEFIEAEEYTVKLSNESGCRAVFMINEGRIGIYIHTSPGDHGVWTKSTLGKRVPLDVTAAGKAILSALPDERVQDIVNTRGLSQKTDQSLSSEEELFRELEDVRNRGYAFNEEEQIQGVNAVGAPVEGPDGNLIGAFSVSGPANRLNGDWFYEELPKTVLGITSEFELRLSLS